MQEDPQLYDYWPYQDRPKIEWPNGAKIAFWVAPNIEFYELNPPENPYRKPWPQTYPAVGGYSIRDYGNRVGHHRISMAFVVQSLYQPRFVIITPRLSSFVLNATGSFLVMAFITLVTPMVYHKTKSAK